MAVVINEFEVLAQPSSHRTQSNPGAATQIQHPEKLEAKDLAPLLRAMQAEALRAWAH
jgi:hypothetical protein